MTSYTDAVPVSRAGDIVRGIVAKTALTTLIGSSFGAGYGALKNQSPGRFAFSQGFNGFVFALPFFTLRDGLIGPVHAFWTGRNHSTTASPPPGSLSPRTYNLIPSSLAAGITGGAIAGWARGPHKIVAGVTTFALVGLGAQAFLNELQIIRIKLVAHYAGGHDRIPELAPAQKDSASSSISTSDPNASSTKAATPPSDQSQAFPDKKELSFWQRHTPVRKVSDDEYASRLAEQLQEAQARVDALQREAAALEAELAQSKHGDGDK